MNISSSSFSPYSHQYHRFKMTQSNSNNPAMDQQHYHYHEHHHHHYYHHQYDDHGHQHDELHSKFNELSTNHHHHHRQNPLKPTYQVYCRADYNCALTVRDGKVVLAPANPSDPHQHWYKEEKFRIQAKDEAGLPSFALVNKATGEAIKHSADAAQPVQLTHYDPDAALDHSILYSEACIRDDGDYKGIRMVNNIRLFMDAEGAVKESGGVRDGNIVILWEWNGGDNQRWKIVPY